MSDEEHEESSLAGYLPGEGGHSFPIYRREDGEEEGAGACSNCGKLPSELMLGPTTMRPCQPNS